MDDRSGFNGYGTKDNQSAGRMHPYGYPPGEQTMLECWRPTMARKSKETDEQIVNRWLKGAIKNFSYDVFTTLGWEPGQVSHITLIQLGQDVHYERFHVSGGYIVIEWDDDGNVCLS